MSSQNGSTDDGRSHSHNNGVMSANSNSSVSSTLQGGLDMSIFAAAVAAAAAAAGGQQLQQQHQQAAQQQQQAAQQAAQQQQQAAQQQQQNQQLAALLAGLKQASAAPMPSQPHPVPSFYPSNVSNLFPQQQQQYHPHPMVQQQQQQMPAPPAQPQVAIDFSTVQAQLAALLSSSTGLQPQQQQQSQATHQQQPQQQQHIAQPPQPPQQQQLSHPPQQLSHPQQQQQQQQSQQMAIEEFLRSAVAQAAAAVASASASGSVPTANTMNPMAKQPQVPSPVPTNLPPQSQSVVGATTTTSSSSHRVLTPPPLPHPSQPRHQQSIGATSTSSTTMATPSMLVPSASSQNVGSVGPTATTTTTTTSSSTATKGRGTLQQQHPRQRLPAGIRGGVNSNAGTNSVTSNHHHHHLGMIASNPMFSEMQSWPLDRLEQHVNVLQQLNQHVPHNLLMLVQDARRRAEKRHAKRIANRKSASTSRARKKALVKEMTELNARLKRQALILALLPDLVIVIDLQGVITFCSAQVERVLQHNVDDLVGANLQDILVPSSRGQLQNLMKELTRSSASTATSCPTNNGNSTAVVKIGCSNSNIANKQQQVVGLLPVAVGEGNTEDDAIMSKRPSDGARMLDLVGSNSHQPSSPGSRKLSNAKITAAPPAAASGTTPVPAASTTNVKDLIPPSILKSSSMEDSAAEGASVPTQSKMIVDVGDIVSVGGAGEEDGAITSTFPLSVVNVEKATTSLLKKCPPGTRSSDAENDNSDASGNDGDSGQQPSSLTESASSLGGKNHIVLSNGEISNTTNHNNTNGPVKSNASKNNKDGTMNQVKNGSNNLPSSDLSNSSSNSTDATNLQNANANLERNVRWHNKKMKDKEVARSGYMVDDVIGAAVTANNASARLSSLQHHAESAPASSCSSDGEEEDDSGYHESNDSREADTSSSEWESKSETNVRQKPLAPTCNICLIRRDRTTLWCEVASSIRSKAVDEDEVMDDSNTFSEAAKSNVRENSKTMSGHDDKDSNSSSTEDNKIAKPPVPQVQEILLCLRPIRDGSLSKVGKESAAYRHRFNAASSKKLKKIINFPAAAKADAADAENSASSEGKRVVSEEANSGPSSDGTRTEGDTSSGELCPPKQLEASFKPLKKRPPMNDDDGNKVPIMGSIPNKRKKLNRQQPPTTLLDSSSFDASVVVESLMLMNKQHQRNNA